MIVLPLANQLSFQTERKCCFPLSISRFLQVRWLNGTMRKHRSRQRQNRPLQFSLLPVPAVAVFFGAIERDGNYGSSAVLKAPRHQPC
jgi:hypothetical protein